MAVRPAGQPCSRIARRRSARAAVSGTSASLVLEAVSRLTEGRTVLVIAHLPEPVADADVVVALRAGRVIGDHRPEPSDAQNGRVARIAFEGRP